MWGKGKRKSGSSRFGRKSAPPNVTDSVTDSSAVGIILSPGALESNSQDSDQRESRKSEEGVPSASSPWASKGMRAIRTFSIDSEDIDPWAMREQLDEYPGKGHWQLKQHLDRYILLTDQDLKQDDLASLTSTLRISPPTENDSDEWFERFHTLSKVLESKTSTPVKIAVIDGGVLPHDFESKKITWRNFVTEGDSNVDSSGPDIVSLDLIRKVYDRDELSVAVVSPGSSPNEHTADYMARAIEWAIGEEVDIISIAIGLETRTERLEKILRKAATASILVFACAGTGKNMPIAYPARMRNVFCMFSTDGHLNVSKFNPPPSPFAENFAILGEGVSAGKRRSDGTSVSAAIAAGVAALLLDFVRQGDASKKIHPDALERVRTKDGMTALFQLMSRRANGYDCIAPWLLLPRRYRDDEDARERAWQTISEALLHL